MPAPAAHVRPELHRNTNVNEPAAAAAIQTECVIVGAGPVGLFAVFELGLLGMKCEIVDSLAHPGGQCTELYPDKPIYDIPALPVCGAQELIDRLLEQIKPFHAGFHLGQEVTAVAREAAGRFTVDTAAGTRFDTGSLVIAGGLGSFQPRRLLVPDAERYEGTQLLYRVRRAEDFHGKDVLIAGGGDSALDWVLEFCGKARSVTLVHRRAEFRAQPASVARMQSLAASGRLGFHEGTIQTLASKDGRLSGATILRADKSTVDVGCELVLACFGLHPKLGPIAEWGLALEKKALKVDTERFQTSEPGIFAIGDINTYPGKKKLILSGFHEAALAAFGVQHHVYPAKRQFLQYTTTSPIMRERLGVSPPE
jgi:thioredoxin reductase (NADPH)